MIARSVMAVEKVREMLDFEATDKDRDRDSTLGEIMHLVDMPSGVTSEGWSLESARLYAIDIAMTTLRRNVDRLSESDKQRLLARLQEARTLVVSGRDSELGFIQSGMEAHLPLTEAGPRRQIWLAAIDALLPSPFRAALISTTNALSMGTSAALTDMSTLLRDRLLARLGEGSHTSEPPGLFRIA